jgi:hypothetical protein
MLVGTVRELKNHDYRVGLTGSVWELTRNGRRVLEQSGAGDGVDAAGDACIVHDDKITDAAVADELQLDYTAAERCVA